MILEVVLLLLKEVVINYEIIGGIFFFLFDIRIEYLVIKEFVKLRYLFYGGKSMLYIIFILFFKVKMLVFYFLLLF